VAKLAAESGCLDYRVVTSDAATARRVAAQTPGIQVTTGATELGAESDVVVARGAVGAVDAFVAGLVGAGVAVRELRPVVSPLEAAFLALTGADDPGPSREDAR
jgi:ABC-2 type transport system ATP-binding protein